MKKLLILVVLAVGGWFVYMNWESRTGNSLTTDDHVTKEYKKSLDKARAVEDTLKKAQEKAQQRMKDI